MNILWRVGRNILGLALCFALIISIGSGVYATELAESETAGPEEDLDPAQISQGTLVDFDIAGTAYYEEARSLLAMVNDLRASLGIAPLAFNMQLEDLALLRAAESSVYWNHMRPDGSYLYETDKNVDGENIQSGIAQAETIFNTWVHSPGHYENMVNPEYKSIGIGAYSSIHGEPARWWAQVFSRTLEGTTMPDRQNGATVTQRIRVNPDFLAMKILTGGQINSSLTSADFGQKSLLRIKRGDQVQLYGMVHYKVSEPSDWPGSVPQEDLVWENSSPSVVKLEAGGKLTAIGLGEATITVSHRQIPALTMDLQVQVLPVNRFRLTSLLNTEASQALFQEIQTTYAAKPSVENFEGESSPEANKAKEMAYRFYDQLGTSPELEKTALQLAQQYSLFLFPDSLESLPGLGQLVESFAGKQRIFWQCFSDLDKPEDQVLQVPGWAQSAAALVLDSAGHKLYMLLYSDASPTASEQNFADLFDDPAKLAISSVNPFMFTYNVDLFADRDDFVLSFSDHYQALQQLDLTQAQAPNLVFNELGQIVYRPQLFLARTEPGPFPPVEPDFSALLYEVDQPELASFDEEGNLVIKAAGSFNLRVDLVDPSNNQVLASATLPINNYIPIEPMAEENTQATQAAPAVTEIDPETQTEETPVP